MKNILYILVFTTMAFFGLHSCSSFLEIDPPVDKITATEAFDDSVNIVVAANGLYTYNMASNAVFFYYMPLLISTMADESFHKSTNFDELKANTYNEYSNYIDDFWREPYQSVYVSNLFLEQLELSDPNLLSTSKREQFKAEAIFFRAFSHLTLTLLFGDVPYITTSNVAVTSKQAAITREEIFTNIVTDLLYAEEVLVKQNISNIYISVHAVRALLARIYTYQKEWTKAIDMSSKVINESGAIMDELENVFLRSGKEAIFKMTSANSPDNTYVDRTRLGVYTKHSSYLYLRPELLNDFEEGDLRYTEWVTPRGADFQSNKYKLNKKPEKTEDAEEFMILRLAEQILIRAEARINRNTGSDLAGAHQDLNTIRDRAKLPQLKNLSQQELIEALYQERRIELFFEDCYRWVDMARWGIIDQKLGAMKDKKWASGKELMPIPQVELYGNINLVQNAAYIK